ncbi:MAG: NifB/NifX family molybdenum-iron cluster-binding protein [Bacillota bacterium]
MESIGIRKPDVDLVDENQTAGLVHMSSSGNPAARQEHNSTRTGEGWKAMRIAVACDNGKVSAHFGHCQEYRLYDVVDGKISDSSSLANPGHQPGFLPDYLASHGVNCIIAGGMGPRAVELFEQNNVKVVLGAEGDTDEVVSKYLEGSLNLGKSTCEHD